jgi:hypothetical protein
MWNCCLFIFTAALSLRSIRLQVRFFSVWTIVLSVWLVHAAVMHPQQLSAAEPERAGNTIRLPVTRDLWVSGVGAESNGNNGSAPRLKLKSIQEMSLLDFDFQALQGQTIERATLHVRLAGEERLWRVTVGSVAADWVEGTGSGYQVQAGSSTFARRQHPQIPWTLRNGLRGFSGYSDLTSITLGNSNSLWRMADAFPPDKQGWQRVAVDPDVIATCIAKLSHGVILFDDTGSEWTRSGERVKIRTFPNRFLHSRESNRDSAPYLSVTLAGEDRQAPAMPTELHGETRVADDVMLRLTWKTPADVGAAGVLGFHITLDGLPLTREFIPLAHRTGEMNEAEVPHIHDWLECAGSYQAQTSPTTENSAPPSRGTRETRPARAARVVKYTVSAVDRAGNIGPAAEGRVMIPPPPTFSLLSSATRADSTAAAPTKLDGNPAGTATISRAEKLGARCLTVVDIADTVLPRLQPVKPSSQAGAAAVPGDETAANGKPSFQFIPARSRGYADRNHLWDATSATVQLQSARQEIVSFQLLLGGIMRPVQASLTWQSPVARGAPKTLPTPKPLPTPIVRWGQLLTVPGPDGPVFDPVLPLADGRSRIAVGTARAAGDTLGLVCEVEVPPAAAAGRWLGELKLSSDQGELQLRVQLDVQDFALPAQLSFLPEMNCYGLPANELDYYRLAHRHRTVLNRVPYAQNGEIAAGCAPVLRDGHLDWSAWDRRFGPLFDGSAFADLPRASVPIECFYLPLHENWPTTMAAGYQGGYWADHAFTPEYRAAFVEMSKQFAEHLSQRGWHSTMFQGFLNNKVDFKVNGWSRASSPWLLDEPANWHDYWALRWFGLAFHEGVRQASPAARLAFRADISRPEWQRDSLDDVLDYNVVQGGAFHRYRSLVLNRKQKFKQTVVVYGGTSKPSQNRLQPVAWCWDSWLSGADGVLPWQTVGTDQSWQQDEDTCLFYPGGPIEQREPVVSLRLKAYLRGQQDAEYLALTARTLGVERLQLAEAVRELLQDWGVTWKAESHGTGAAVAEDAGRLEFRQLSSELLARVRAELMSRLVSAKPADVHPIADVRFPVRLPDDHPLRGGLVRRGDLPPPSDPSTVADEAARTATGMIPGKTTLSKTPGSSPAKPIISGGMAVTRTIQGRPRVADAIIDPQATQKNFGDVPRDLRLARAETGSVLLLKFDLQPLSIPSGATLRRAHASVFVWDPSSQGKMRVDAAPLLTAWEERSVTWQRPTASTTWKGPSFSIGKDTNTVLATATLEPDPKNDIVDPPREYRWEITELVQSWLEDPAKNHGLALIAVPDRAIDDGQHARVQIYGSEWRESQVTPKLTLEFIVPQK